MKRILTATTLCLFVIAMVGSVGVGEDYLPMNEDRWNNLPDWQKFTLKIGDSSGKTKLSIAGYYFTRSIVKDFYGGRLEGKAEAYVNAVESIWPDRTVLAVAVSPWASKSGGQKYSPEKFEFSQGESRHTVDTEQEILGEEMFFGGELKAVTAGFIAIPEGINTNRDFIIRYGNVSAEMEELQ